MGAGSSTTAELKEEKRVGGMVLTATQSSMGPRMIHQIFLFPLVPQHLQQRAGSRRRLNIEMRLNVRASSHLEEGC